MEQIAPKLFKEHTSLKKNLLAYAEGLGLPLNKVSPSFVMPEILCSHNVFNPGIMSALLGCSSLFYKSPETQNICHFRILDLPLNGYYAEHAQTILFQFPKQKVFFFTCKGMPYPSLTAMNESGLTLALHQQPCNFFNYRGTPIFELTKTIMAEVKDRQDLMKMVKSHESMSGWNIYCCLKEEVFDIQFQEKQKPTIRTHHLQEGETLYFGNEPSEEIKDAKIQPYGFCHFNNMRKESLQRYLAENKPLSQKTILKGLSTPLGHKGDDSREWKHPPLSLHSVDLCMLDPGQSSALKMEGPAPKSFPGTYTIYHDCLSLHTKMSQGREESHQDHHLSRRGLHYFSRCTRAYRQKNIPQLFHTLQMAHECYQGWPEQNIVHCYYLVMEYIFLTSTRDEHSLLKKFEQLAKKLPPYLEQQRRLFVLRLHKLLEIEPSGELSLDDHNLNGCGNTRISSNQPCYA